MASGWRRRVVRKAAYIGGRLGDDSTLLVLPFYYTWQ
jgi:hypothetical protein